MKGHYVDMDLKESGCEVVRAVFLSQKGHMHFEIHEMREVS
jgi:hypothetical protein